MLDESAVTGFNRHGVSMAIVDYHLFRIHLLKKHQMTLNQQQIDRHQALVGSLMEQVPFESRYGLWMVGEVTPLDDAVQFQFGRLKREQVELFRDGRFEIDELERWPHTVCLIDLEHSVLAVRREDDVAVRVSTVASRLVELLNNSKQMRSSPYEAQADRLSDPGRLVETVRAASSVHAMWVSFNPPNPLDSDEDFVKPLKREMERIRADSSTVQFHGDLDKGEVVKLAEEAAAEGKGATVQLRDEAPDEKRTVRLGETPLVLKLSLNVSVDGVLKAVRDKFDSIREYLGK